MKKSGGSRRNMWTVGRGMRMTYNVVPIAARDVTWIKFSSRWAATGLGADAWRRFANQNSSICRPFASVCGTPRSVRRHSGHTPDSRIVFFPLSVPLCRGRDQDFSLGSQDWRTEGRERGWGSGEGQQPAPHQLGVLGERSGVSAMSSPIGVRGGAETAQRFSTIFSTQDGLS